MEAVLLHDYSALQLLEKVKHLYLREICEPRDNSLRIVVTEAVVSSRKPEPQPGGFLAQAVSDAGALEGANPIETTDSCRVFELYWKHYVAYLVTEECAGSRGIYSDELYSGTLLRRYSKSHFLEHLERDTGGYGQPLLHFKLVCLNHLIDVASEESPVIKLQR